MKANVAKMKKLYLKNVKWDVVSADCTWYVEIKRINIIAINKNICINQWKYNNWLELR